MGQSAMDDLLAWALWIIPAAVKPSPGLVLLLVRPIARLLHRLLWPLVDETGPVRGICVAS
jgi:hypothetical protein